MVPTTEQIIGLECNCCIFLYLSKAWFPRDFLASWRWWKAPFLSILWTEFDHNYNNPRISFILVMNFRHDTLSATSQMRLKGHTWINDVTSITLCVRARLCSWNTLIAFNYFNYIYVYIYIGKTAENTKVGLIIIILDLLDRS